MPEAFLKIIRFTVFSPYVTNNNETSPDLLLVSSLDTAKANSI
jgi:hypothetical protein